MADNGGSSADPAGNIVDWIELYNPGEQELDLDGWWISDDAEEPQRHALSQVSVPAGGFLVLYADGAPELGPEHLDLSLDKAGEVLLLTDAEGRRVDQLSFPSQGLDVAAARSSDGAPTWLLTASPSPGEPNPSVALDAPTSDSEALCGLTSLPQPAWFVEGDTVELALSCEGELSLDSAEVELIRAPEGAVLAGGSLSFGTGLADAGVHRFVLSLRAAGATDHVPEAGEVQAWVADDYDNPDNELVDPLLYTEEWGLPVVHLDPEGAVSQSYGDATVSVQGRAYTGQMKIRGASSASFPKPSYTLAFEDEEVVFPGWERSRKRMVLLSTFDDNAYTRQKLIYDQWEATAEVSGDHRLCPHTEFAVVYLEGVYFGLYVLLDHVDDEFLAHRGLNGDGNLYKAVNHEANFYLTGTNGSAKSDLASGYEKKEGEPVDDFSDLQALVAFTGGSEAAEIVADNSYLDPVEFMDWFLLVHYALAEDSAGKNSYLFNDPLDGGFRFVPWDFNHAWGQNWYTARRSSDSLNEYKAYNLVFWALQDDEAATTALWERFELLRGEGGPYDLGWQLAQLDTYYAQIQPSATRDWARWEESYRSHWWAAYRSDWTSYEEEKAYLYLWAEERAALFDAIHP